MISIDWFNPQKLSGDNLRSRKKGYYIFYILLYLYIIDKQGGTDKSTGETAVEMEERTEETPVEMEERTEETAVEMEERTGARRRDRWVKWRHKRTGSGSGDHSTKQSPTKGPGDVLSFLNFKIVTVALSQTHIKDAFFVITED